jgi:hypothetical protein
MFKKYTNPIVMLFYTQSMVSSFHSTKGGKIVGLGFGKEKFFHIDCNANICYYYLFFNADKIHH